jgi:hypothetical protein
MAELVWAMRRFVERLADQAGRRLVRRRALSRTSFLGALDSIASRSTPSCFCAPPNPPFPKHQSFVEAATAIVLAPLTDEQCASFLQLLLGETLVGAPSTASWAADGNRCSRADPLHVDRRRTSRDVDGRWHVDSDSRRSNPGDHRGRPHCRLDRLPREERHVIEPRRS